MAHKAANTQKSLIPIVVTAKPFTFQIQTRLSQ